MSERYDVIIIGAGIGGLVCGCFLAKEGKKVLIVEKHYQVGGYCTSFTRNGIVFDAGPHLLSSLRSKGILSKILGKINLDGKIDFLSSKVIERIITPNVNITIKKDSEEIISELIDKFPKEKSSIYNFFGFIRKTDFLQILSQIRSQTLKDLLDFYFKNEDLKTVLAIPILGSLGLPPSQASALAAVVLYEEFLLDGGYYPKGGMQIFSNALRDKFQELGGELHLSSTVTRILTKNRTSIGVESSKNGVLLSNYVVSNADAYLTFNELIVCPNSEENVMNSLELSPSTYMIFLGLKEPLRNLPKSFVTWYTASNNIEDWYSNHNSLVNLNSFVLSHPSLIDSTICNKNKGMLRILMQARYSSSKKWANMEASICDSAIDKVSKILPDIKSLIETREVGSPHTLFGYTLNRKGSAFGWASTSTQIYRNNFPYETSIRNLFICGHWATNGFGQSGVTAVAISGERTARRIISDIGRAK
jgi:all-trans-retinol 13,14-reductase